MSGQQIYICTSSQCNQTQKIFTDIQQMNEMHYNHSYENLYQLKQKINTENPEYESNKTLKQIYGLSAERQFSGFKKSIEAFKKEFDVKISKLEVDVRKHSEQFEKPFKALMEYDVEQINQHQLEISRLLGQNSETMLQELSNLDEIEKLVAKSTKKIQQTLKDLFEDSLPKFKADGLNWSHVRKNESIEIKGDNAFSNEGSSLVLLDPKFKFDEKKSVTLKCTGLMEGLQASVCIVDDKQHKDIDPTYIQYNLPSIFSNLSDGTTYDQDEKNDGVKFQDNEVIRLEWADKKLKITNVTKNLSKEFNLSNKFINNPELNFGAFTCYSNWVIQT